MQPSLIFIVGPTGVGKSDVGFLLAKHRNGAIINADAMQVYRGIDIASDKPTSVARQALEHHLIDVVDVTDVFDVAQYRALAVDAIEDVLKRGKIPLIVGGSGLYVSILLDGIFKPLDALSPTQKMQMKKLREELELLAIHDAPTLHEKLQALDPQAAARIHAHDAKRIVRALEVVMITGQPISQLQQHRQGLWGEMPITYFGLNRDRTILYDRVEKRVEMMFTKGIIEEMRNISHLPLSRTAATLIGIPEVMGFLRGEFDLERTKYLMKLNTRHLVKRQLTWFRRDKRITWIDMKEGQSAADVVETISLNLRKEGIY